MLPSSSTAEAEGEAEDETAADNVIDVDADAALAETEGDANDDDGAAESTLDSTDEDAAAESLVAAGAAITLLASRRLRPKGTNMVDAVEGAEAEESPEEV